MYGMKDDFTDESAGTCKKWVIICCLEVRVCCLEKGLEELSNCDKKRLKSVMQRLSALKRTSNQKNDGGLRAEENGKKTTEEAVLEST